MAENCRKKIIFAGVLRCFLLTVLVGTGFAGEVRRRVGDELHVVERIVFNEDSTLIASLISGELRTFDAATGKELWRRRFHGSQGAGVNERDWDRIHGIGPYQGGIIAIGVDSVRLYTWAGETVGEPIKLQGVGQMEYREIVAVSADGRRFALTMADGVEADRNKNWRPPLNVKGWRVEVFDSSDGKMQCATSKSPDPGSVLVFSPGTDGLLVAGLSGKVSLIQVDTCDSIWTHEITPIAGGDILKDGTILLTTKEGLVSIKRGSSPDLIAGGISDELHASQDQRCIVGGSTNGSLVVLRLSDRKYLANVRLGALMMSNSISPDCSMVAAGTVDGNLIIRQIKYAEGQLEAPSPEAKNKDVMARWPGLGARLEEFLTYAKGMDCDGLWRLSYEAKAGHSMPTTLQGACQSIAGTYRRIGKAGVVPASQLKREPLNNRTLVVWVGLQQQQEGEELLKLRLLWVREDGEWYWYARVPETG